jgi:hypothetical protein
VQLDGQFSTVAHDSNTVEFNIVFSLIGCASIDSNCDDCARFPRKHRQYRQPVESNFGAHPFIHPVNGGHSVTPSTVSALLSPVIVVIDNSCVYIACSH